MKSSFKNQKINTVWVFTEDNQVFIKKGKYNRNYVPLRWIPVTISE
ncbi:hypothetical protein [Croceitalea rosinachiae]|uniref:Uncharacterized protein n=1 Tax=Croceitalea rosinachiae TaxID=3075596 RepID=A0ABU3ACI0_9FLAO|nr:hypothetical protein [Croceitalea sp. F388]MDT0607505.1 hypothetical protein [Croceitalea sp. F388]